MAKGAYIGVNNVARKVKNIYVGVNGVARRIKKAYIGIGGVARPCLGSGELTSYGTITPLSAARGDFAATTVGNYALFGGGFGATYYSTVDAYNHTLTHSLAEPFLTFCYFNAATTIGDYALFGGGYAPSSCSSHINIYDKLLTRSFSDSANRLSTARRHLAATTVGNYALFGGGETESSSTNVVDAYDASLTRTTPQVFPSSASECAATTVGNYAVFAGGKWVYYDGTYSVSIDVRAYDTALTRTINIFLDKGRFALAATTVGNYALFAGGNEGEYNGGYGRVYDIVEAFDTSLTRTIVSAPLTNKVYELSATSVGDYAIFAGGWDDAAIRYKTVNIYNSSLTKTTDLELSSPRMKFAATTNGDYAIFAGGASYTSMTWNNVDVYTV